MMQPPRRSFTLQVRLAIGLAGFALAACGGSTFDPGSGSTGDAAVGGSQGLGGGTGAAMGGAHSGDGGAPSATGGAPSGCSQDSDCVNCAYTKAPADSSQCYCAICADTPMTKAECDINQSAWQENCAHVLMACPAIACVMPEGAVCVSGQCVPASTRTAD